MHLEVNSAIRKEIVETRK